MDWRLGAEHFEEYLLDHDPASNWGKETLPQQFTVVVSLCVERPGMRRSVPFFLASRPGGVVEGCRDTSQNFTKDPGMLHQSAANAIIARGVSINAFCTFCHHQPLSAITVTPHLRLVER